MNYEEFLDKGSNIALVGVSPNKSKFGYRVYKTLKDYGFNVFAVNPNYDDVGGDKSYHCLEEIPNVDEVVTVIPPKATVATVQNCVELEIKKVWMQPGSQSKEAIELCKKEGVDCIYDACIIADALRMPFTV